ncbi:MAG TPA: glycosyltransferase family 2 protein, partial [Draconibacterium sp.]|nr:glycosyltransferase family 2 protein [Draconibacterium sp.]
QFFLELDELNSNCSRLETFQVRFFQKFNAFKILKYLNFVHENYYQKADLRQQLLLLEASEKKFQD